jgi:hypothetical protein
MSKIKLIYDINAYWEIDYIKELCSKIDYDFIFVKIDKLENEEIINNNILVFSSNIYTFYQILYIVLRIKPLIIIHLSDEFGTKPEYTNLASHTKLYLHQHYFKHYPYKKYNNIIQIPLGYMTKMFNDKSLNMNLKPINERKYIWSFIGNIKQDRLEIIEKFSNKFKNNIISNKIEHVNIFDIYNNSIFVPSGRGNNRLDCFRIYEAILSGSIPVIVCDRDEYNENFYYNNDIPEFIVEKTWSDAVNRCEYLLNNNDELINIQQNNYKWLKNKIESIQQKILNIILQ